MKQTLPRPSNAFHSHGKNDGQFSFGEGVMEEVVKNKHYSNSTEIYLLGNF